MLNSENNSWTMELANHGNGTKTSFDSQLALFSFMLLRQNYRPYNEKSNSSMTIFKSCNTKKTFKPPIYTFTTSGKVTHPSGIQIAFVTVAQFAVFWLKYIFLNFWKTILFTIFYSKTFISVVNEIRKYKTNVRTLDSLSLKKTTEDIALKYNEPAIIRHYLKVTKLFN